MTNVKKAFSAILSVVIVFLLLFSLFFFAYFMPVKNEHDKIAELPSHNLRLFIEEYAEAQDSDMTRADILTALNNDTFVGSRGYSYLYDDEHSLFMKLGTDTRFWDSSGKATYSIGEYARFRMYYADPGDPLRRALGLGPIYCWVYELSDKKSNIVGTIAESRYWFLYQYSPFDVEVSIVSASLQLAFALAIYTVPLIACLFWRSKKVIFCAIGVYVLIGVANTVYYLANYPWLF